VTLSRLQQALRKAKGSAKPERFLSWRDLFERGAVSSKTQARRLWDEGKFPKPVHLSERVIAFRESEIEAYMASRVYDPQPAHGIAAQSQQLAARKAAHDEEEKEMTRTSKTARRGANATGREPERG
jgi:predicted DNA-binding transcriptional regulator AlpA